jgi:rubrerythrin
MYVYIQSEPSLWTVGFYDPTGRWHPDSDWPSRDEAARRVAYLNGARNMDAESLVFSSQPIIDVDICPRCGGRGKVLNDGYIWVRCPVCGGDNAN